MKKRLMGLLLATAMAFSVAGCGEAKKVTEMIDQIGTVSENSEEVIAAAEAAYEELKEKDKEQVENYDTLTAAREKYDAIQEEIAKEKAREEAYNAGMAAMEKEDYQTAIQKFIESDDYEDAADQIVACQDALITDSVTVIDGDTIEEETSGEAILISRDENEVSAEKNYVGKYVIVTGKVTAIKSDETVFTTDKTYTCPVAIYLEGGWIICVNSSSEVVTKAKAGDTIQAIGIITGFEKYGDSILVAQTEGNAVQACISDEKTAQEDMVKLITAMKDSKFYRDAVKWCTIYKKVYPDDAKNTDILATEAAIQTFCYPGTYIEKYEWRFMSSITDMQEQTDVEKNGFACDYYDSNLSKNVQTYANYLMDRGYEQNSSYVRISVNGESYSYLYFTNKSDNTIIAMAQGSGFVRIVVYSKEIMNQ